MKRFARFQRRPLARNRRRRHNLRSEFLEARHVLAAITGVAFSDTVVDDEIFTSGEGQGGITVSATDDTSGQKYTATTGASGDYTIPVPDGSYTVIATGSAVANDIVYTDVLVSGADATVDLDTSEPGQYVRTMMDPWIPNPLHGSTFRSKLGGGTGFWDDPNTWSANRVPGANDRIIIQTGDEVVVRNTSTIAREIGVYHGGKLRFQRNVNTELKVVTLLVLGELEIGTASAPIASNVTAKVTFRDVAINLNTDPGQFGTGLLALNTATVRIHGATLSETFVRVAQEPQAGDNTLTLTQAPSGWKVGDEIVLPDSRHLRWNELPIDGRYIPEWEELTIAAINGNTITLSSVLQFDHLGARDADGNLDFLPHVMNRTRNIILESADPNGTRGHTLFQGRSDVDVRYAAFKHLGRTKNIPVNNTTWDAHGNATHVGTNQIARYAIHTHHLIGPTTPQSNGHQFTLLGNSVDNGSATHDNKWAITIHGSHYGLIKQNTVYNNAGAAIVTEDGSESYNVFEDNFVVRAHSIGSGSRYSVEAGNFHSGREATGFWFRGPNNYVRNNVAANIFTFDRLETAYGFKYLFLSVGKKLIPASQGDNPMMNGVTVDMNAQAILEFSGNEVYGATDGGLTYWWVGMRNLTPLNVSGTSVIKDLRLWHVHNRGIYAYHSNQVVVDGLVVRGHDARWSAHGAIGYDAFDYPQKSSVIKNVDIQNMNKGLRLSTHPLDTVIEDSLLRNRDRNLIPALPTDCCGYTAHPPARIEIRNVRYGPPEFTTNTATEIWMRYNKGGNLIQLNEVFVYDHNGVPGDDFQVYYLEQAPDYIVPQTTKVLLGSPEAGLTNQQNWDKYGIAIAGAVSPTSQTRTDIHGFVGPLATNSNHPPVSVPDSASITEDSQPNTVSGNVLTNDSDSDGDSLSISKVDGNAGNVGTTTDGSYGSLVLNSNGSYVYTLDNTNPVVQALNNGQTLTDPFTYTVSDGTVGSSTSLTITINGVSDTNQAPAAVNDTATIVEDATRNDVTGNVLTNDSDPDGDSLTVSRVNGNSSDVGKTITGTYGTILINSNGGFRYTLDNSNPAVDALNNAQSLTESFAHVVSDGALSDSATLTIRINGATDNGAPVAVNDVNAITEDSAQNPVSGNVLDNDSDPDGDVLSVVRVKGAAGNVGNPVAGSYGSLNLRADGTYAYTLDNANPAVDALDTGETLTDSFVYMASGSDLGSTATLTITIDGATDSTTPAGATDLVAIASDLFESGSFSGGLGQWSAGNWIASGDASIRTDADPHSGLYHARLRRGSGDLQRVVDVSGLTDVRLRFWSKLSSFESSDQARVQVSGAGSSWTTLTTFVNGQDDNQYHFFELDVPDVGDTLHVRFDAAMSGSRDYWYIDNVEVTGAPAGPPNQAPLITSTEVTTATEDLPYSYDVDASDPDAGDTLTFSLDAFPSGMTIDTNTGVIHWTPSNAQVGSNAVTVRAQDAGGLFDTQSFNITVTNTNDSPTVTSTPATMAAENTAYSYDVDASDPDTGDWLTFSLAASPVGMSIDSSTGVINWTPTNGQVGTHPVTVRAQDNGGLQDEQSFSITVTAAPLTKFYVVDASLDDTFEYDAAGNLEERYNLGSGNTAPRGVAANAAGDTLWVIDNDDYVYVYDTAGTLLRSWKASGLSRSEGIATDGEDLWIVDRGNDRAHFFDGGASRTTNASATSSFALSAGNPRGITTDGTYVWVADTGNDRVYKYTVGGSHLGNWALESANSNPRGITIDPTGASNSIWVVDSSADRVFEYANGRDTSGGSFVGSFSLASGNTNPQGIADPPPFGSSDTGNAQDERAVERADLTVFLDRTEETSSAPRRRAMQPSTAELDRPIVSTGFPQADRSASALWQETRTRDEVFAALEQDEQGLEDDELLNALL